MTGDVPARFSYQGPTSAVYVRHDREQNVWVRPASMPDAQLRTLSMVSLDQYEKEPATQGWMELVAPGQGRVRIEANHADVGQLYRWAGTHGRLTMEWMSRIVHLEVGKSWRTRYTIRYVPGQ